MKYFSPSTGEILTINEIKAKHPNVSFPVGYPEKQLNGYGYFVIHESPDRKPLPDYRKNYLYVTPDLIDGKYYETWQSVNATPEEIADRTKKQTEVVRAERNRLLADCDWTQLSDAPVDATPWATYRQALRDITEQADFPWDVTWPEVPA